MHILTIYMKGTGPWTLYVQVVGPKGSEIIPVQDIKTPRKTIEVLIPPTIDRNGGSFEVDLGTCLYLFHAQPPLSHKNA